MFPKNNADFLSNLSQGWQALKKIPELTYHCQPRDLIFRREKISLYHYQKIGKKTHQLPVLIVFATINRPEILDLYPQKSFINGLLTKGLDVYLLDWGYPATRDNQLNFADYVLRYLSPAVAAVKKHTRHKKINLLGICQGGVICLCYSALFTDIKNLILISTPCDFHTDDNLMSQLVRQWDCKKISEATQPISGLALTQFFIALRPFNLLGKKYLNFVDQIHNKKKTENFLRVEKWLYDAPDQPAVAFSQFIRDCYQENKLIKNKLMLDKYKIDLRHLSLPILNLIAKEDHLIPPSASLALKDHVPNAAYSQQIFPSGHIGIYISDKVGRQLPQAITSWLYKNK